ncbi:uncharacterized protein LOC121733226 [Aricia agestis]|uniref:uncharacterized protein LOC121733226 n=1 Tax=Aricia agestis TaxID=91739 RepID=UPI001C20698E|nr:uncharacterized protein LOC121733226 [Aricia agestis]
MFGYHTKVNFVFGLILFACTSANEHLNNETNDCNLDYNVEKFFEDINAIEVKYAKARKTFHRLVGGKEFDDNMIKEMVSQGGAAIRTAYEHVKPNTIPAGINLGGHVIMRLERTVLMFYRLRLRNNTIFQLDSIRNNFEDMTLSAKLRLNELHLFGTFSSCLRRRKSSLAHDYYLTCRHKYGDIEILLSNVRYKVQGRYRLLQDKLKLEHIVSKLDIEHMGVSLPDRQLSRRQFKNIQEDSKWRSSLDEFIVRLKTDLDKWMLDYFNDYLMYFVELENGPDVDNFLRYDGERTKLANEFVDNTIELLTSRLRDIHQACPKIPDYTISPSTKMAMLELSRGQLMGLDSMYRRSAATVSPGDNREVNAVVGFSNMKVYYFYYFVRNRHPYKGLIVLTADDVSAQLSIKLNKSRKDHEQVVVKLKILNVAETNFLTVRGLGLLPAFKSLLENQIESIMAQTVVKAIKNLGAAARCEPTILVEPFTFDVNSDDNALSDDEEYDDNDKTEEPQNILRHHLRK